MTVGALLVQTLVLLFLWHASGLSWWWLVGIWALGAVVQAVVNLSAEVKKWRDLQDLERRRVEEEERQKREDFALRTTPGATPNPSRNLN